MDLGVVYKIFIALPRRMDQESADKVQNSLNVFYVEEITELYFV